MFIQIYGLEYLVYNNSSKYDHIRELLRKRQENHPTAVEDDVILQQLLPSVDAYQTSFYYQIFPTTKIQVRSTHLFPPTFSTYSPTKLQIRKGCAYIGNPYLPCMVVLTLQRATIIHSIGPATFVEDDYYQSLYEIDCKRVVGFIASNPDYNGQELKVERTVKIREE